MANKGAKPDCTAHLAQRGPVQSPARNSRAQAYASALDPLAGVLIMPGGEIVLKRATPATVSATLMSAARSNQPL